MSEIKPPYFGKMSDKDYFAFPAVDQTELKNWADGPLTWAVSKAGPNENAEPLLFGTAAHALVLGSGAPVVQAPNRRSKAGKIAAQKLQDSGATVLTKADYQTVHAMAAVTHPVFQKMGGRPETAMIARDPETGVLIKGKADWLPAGGDDDNIYWIYDYKTFGHSFDRFGWDAFDRGYHVQAAFYIRLYHILHRDVPLGHIGFRFLVQSKTPGYEYRVFKISPGSTVLEDAWELITAWLTSWKSFPDDRDAMVTAARGMLSGGDAADWNRYVQAYDPAKPVELPFPDAALARLDVQVGEAREDV